MEDSFRVRVDKAFGSLFSDTARNEAPPKSLWSLTDDEIPRKEWSRDYSTNEFDDSKPYSPNLDGFVTANTPQAHVPSSSRPGPSSSAHLQDIDDLCEEDYADADDESNIGKDCTLDYEEEEDEYDKVAVGREKVGDHLCMRDATDTEYGIDINTYKELPHTVEGFLKDPRADHAAAKLRLKEDAEAAGNFGLLTVSDAPDTFSRDGGGNRKSIIKKRVQTDIKNKKRVRFNTSSSEGSLIDPKENGSVKEHKVSGGDANMVQDASVPDYIKNPSHYTHYTFDEATDMDDDSNRKAYLDFLSLVRKPDTAQAHCQHDDMEDYLVKSLTFNRRKTDHGTNTDIMGIKNLNVLVVERSRVGIAVNDDVADEVSAMDEDDHGMAIETTNSKSHSSRQYRAKTKKDFEDQE